MGLTPAINPSRQGSTGSMGMPRFGSVILDSGGIPHDDNLNTLNDLKRTVQASLYTELAPLLTPRRLPPSRIQDGAV